MPKFNPDSIRSLAVRTDMMFHRVGGQIQLREDYLVVRTPDNPGYFYGNFLLYPGPPLKGDAAIWLQHFSKEFGATPAIKHVCIVWDGERGEVGAATEFEIEGFELDLGVVLTATQVHAPTKSHAGAEVRTLSTDEEWDVATKIQIASRHPRYDLATYTPYKVAQMVGYRRMVAAGRGDWYGAFVDGKQCANLGLFFEGGLGRFQMVGTAPDARRQGLCGRLVYEASRMALGAGRAKQLVMVADSEYFAARIYESVGFKPTEHIAGVLRVPT